MRDLKVGPWVASLRVLVDIVGESSETHFSKGEEERKRGNFSFALSALCDQRNFWSTLSTQMSDLKRLLLASSPLSRRLANET